MKSSVAVFSSYKSLHPDFSGLQINSQSTKSYHPAQRHGRLCSRSNQEFMNRPRCLRISSPHNLHHMRSHYETIHFEGYRDPLIHTTDTNSKSFMLQRSSARMSLQPDHPCAPHRTPTMKSRNPPASFPRDIGSLQIVIVEQRLMMNIS